MNTFNEACGSWTCDVHVVVASWRRKELQSRREDHFPSTGEVSPPKRRHPFRTNTHRFIELAG